MINVQNKNSSVYVTILSPPILCRFEKCECKPHMLSFYPEETPNTLLHIYILTLFHIFVNRIVLEILINLLYNIIIGRFLL